MPCPIAQTGERKETDLIYEGIATFSRLLFYFIAQMTKETDLIYEGIATQPPRDGLPE